MLQFRGSVVMSDVVKFEPTGGVCLNARENAPTSPSTVVQVTASIRTARLSCSKAGKARTFTPSWDSSGECRI